jgi:hypothetical protein
MKKLMDDVEKRVVKENLARTKDITSPAQKRPLKIPNDLRLMTHSQRARKPISLAQ